MASTAAATCWVCTYRRCNFIMASTAAATSWTMQLHHGVYCCCDFLGLYMIDDATPSWRLLLLRLLGFVHDRQCNSIMAPIAAVTSWVCT
ncbi:hypothetical protein Csa_023034 [Cucumis sativus]|nr:hypothetical protein Csa_023034 [Cucumis sativus]